MNKEAPQTPDYCCFRPLSDAVLGLASSSATLKRLFYGAKARTKPNQCISSSAEKCWAICSPSAELLNPSRLLRTGLVQPKGVDRMACQWHHRALDNHTPGWERVWVHTRLWLHEIISVAIYSTASNRSCPQETIGIIPSVRDHPQTEAHLLLIEPCGKYMTRVWMLQALKTNCGNVVSLRGSTIC